MRKSLSPLINSMFRNHKLKTTKEDDTDTSKIINITSLVSKNLSLDMDYDIVRAFLLGDSTPIKQHVEQFMSLLKIKSPTSTGLGSLLRQDTRDEDSEVS